MIDHPVYGYAIRKGKNKTLTEDAYGYSTVKLSKGGHDVRLPVHRLVAEAFIECQDKSNMEVNHIDFDRKNNHADNLEWVTHSDNIRHSSNAGRYSGKYGSSNANYGNHKLHDRYSEDKQLAMEKQSRPGAQNGRARPVRATNCITQQQIDFKYLEECARYLIDNGFTRKDARKTQPLANRITRAIRQGSEYCHHKFEYLA